MSLDLNYKPKALIDTSTLTEEEWLMWRKRGIGGSDVAAALNLSPYKTARELYYDKIGVEPAIEGPDKTITFAIGHLLEDVVAQIFAKKTGFTIFRDQTMYQHPIYPFMLADVDRFITLPNGETAILECKTSHFNTQFNWANGSVPRHYELQVRHYMSVMNINTAYIACLFSNSEDDFVWQKIERDLDEEESNILLLEDFWTRYVCQKQEPPLVEKPDLVLEAIRRFHGPADKTAPEIYLGKENAVKLEQILQWKDAKLALERQARKLGDLIKGAYAPIVDQMGIACHAVCETSDATYRISYTPTYRESISKTQLSQLRAQHPEIYRDYTDITESRTFGLSKAAK